MLFSFIGITVLLSRLLLFVAHIASEGNNALLVCRTKSRPDAREHTIEQDDGIDNDGYAYILPGGRANQREEVKDKICTSAFSIHA